MFFGDGVKVPQRIQLEKFISVLISFTTRQTDFLLIMSMTRLANCAFVSSSDSLSMGKLHCKLERA
jgi:hypothetical protein